jgi:hypothetical protein
MAIENLTTAEVHDLIDNTITEIIHACQDLYPLNWQDISSEILYKNNLIYATEPKIEGLVKKLRDLEQQSDNPWIQMFNKMQ